jgi:Asp-tRNA(Asn)/Glu-tRNA(Gln) amidotransferase A subunit family amidase
MQIVAKPGRDAALLEFANRFQEAAAVTAGRR